MKKTYIVKKYVITYLQYLNQSGESVMKKTTNQSQVNVVFSEHKNAIVLISGYLCVIATAFLPMFIK